MVPSLEIPIPGTPHLPRPVVHILGVTIAKVDLRHHQLISEIRVLPPRQTQRIQVPLLLPVLIHPVSVSASARLPLLLIRVLGAIIMGAIIVKLNPPRHQPIPELPALPRLPTQRIQAPLAVSVSIYPVSVSV